MRKLSYLEEQIEKHRHDPVFVTHGAMLDLVEEIVARMEALGMTRRELADKSGLQPAQITRVLGGEHNLTFRTLGRVLVALDCEFGVRLRPLERKPKVAKVRARNVSPEARRAARVAK